MEANGKQAGHTDVYFYHKEEGEEEEEEEEELEEEEEEKVEKTRWHFNLYEDWMDLFEWQSACYGFSVIKKTELLFVNGKFIQGYEWEPELSKGWGDYPLTIKLMEGWRGEVTDLNIYDSAFEEDEMISWTTSCETPADGGILSWRPEMYNLTNNNDTETVIDEVAADDLCPSKNMKADVLEFFDDGVGRSPAMSEEMCARLNGQLNLIPVTDERGFATTREFEDFAIKTNRSNLCFWVAGKASANDTEMIEVKEGFQVYQKGGKWVIKDPYTDEILGIPLFLLKTGHTYAELTQECFACCANLEEDSSSKSPFEGKFCKGRGKCKNNFNCWSQKCERSDLSWLGLICSFKQKVKLRLKGSDLEFVACVK